MVRNIYIIDKNNPHAQNCRKAVWIRASKGERVQVAHCSRGIVAIVRK